MKSSITMTPNTPDRSVNGGSKMEMLSSIKKTLMDVTDLVDAMMLHEDEESMMNVSPIDVVPSSPFRVKREEVIDLTYSPEPDDDKENYGSNISFGMKVKVEKVVATPGMNVKLEKMVAAPGMKGKVENVVATPGMKGKVVVENVAPPTVAKASATNGNAKSHSTNKKGSPKSHALMSTVDGFKRAIKTMHVNGRSRDINGSRPIDQVLLATATENDTIGSLVYEVRAKPYRRTVEIDHKSVEYKVLDPWGGNKIFSVKGVLKLYRREVCGTSQLVLRDPANGTVKLNLAIRGMDQLVLTIPNSKKGRKEFGQVSFLASAEKGVLEQFTLKVIREEVGNLYWNLVDLGATPMNRVQG